MRKAESMRIRVERHVQFSNCVIKKKKTNSLETRIYRHFLAATQERKNLLDLYTIRRSGRDPMDGHIYVVGRTSTQSLGKPGATRSARVASGIGKSLHHPPLLWNTGVSGREETKTATTERAHACRESYQSEFFRAHLRMPYEHPSSFSS